MKISAKAEYACLAVLELALRADQPEPVRASDIAEANDIPQRFLVQILLQLKGAGYVASTRGSSGGYRLAVEPDKLTLWEVIQTIDGPAASSFAEQPGAKSPGWRVLHEVWQEVSRIETEQLKQIDFLQLVRKASQADSNMYYI